MSSVTPQNPRNSCALRGAVQTIQAIEGFVPILHSTAGCAVGGSLAQVDVGYAAPPFDAGESEIPSTNVFERHVIFGGASRLREEIKNTVKVLKGELYLVVTGCATELIGDDVPAMVKEAQEQHFPVAYVEGASFRGDAMEGHHQTVRSILDWVAALPEIKRGNQPLVNLFGIVPGRDAFLDGEYDELARVLGLIGVQVNRLFGYGSSLETWRQVPHADLTIAFGHSGKKLAQYAAKKFETPFVCVDSLPVGVEQTVGLLHAVASALKLDASDLPGLAEEQERRFAYALDKWVNGYFGANIQREFIVAGDAARVGGLTDFLQAYLGLVPAGVVVLDRLGKPEKENLRAQLPDVDVLCSEDGAEIERFIREIQPELLLASALEEPVSRELHIPLRQISYPVADQIALHKSYVGFDGAFALVEDLYGTLRTFSQRQGTELCNGYLSRACKKSVQIIPG
ncbi:MAG: nitrogenase component 1 [Ethanoligenens sp.]